ncbi:DUF4209 domain-containing protein [Priestia megaterium]|uniref:DUF4209 domain-containing protein n=1 Tax=Priestia megaterium TaxID=1404 RepID=UPI002E239666|nr:DUF4209 domain-containing protein [Priestia megaterium]
MNVKDDPLAKIMPTEILNKEGKVISNSSSKSFHQPSKLDEGTINFQVHKDMQTHRKLFVEAIIEPIRNQILLEHFITLRHLFPLVVNNPFIPEGREEIYVRGLLSGLQGDFLVSSHLLIPQLENSIRYILTKEGEIVSNLDKNGIQEEKNVNTLLYMPKLEELLGKDIVFDLQGLLVEKSGHNVRNIISHGLSSYDDFNSITHVYTWWITLKLCYLYKVG